MKSKVESKVESKEPSPAPQTDEEIVIECDLPQAPETVWRAVTVPDLLTAWLFEAEGLPGLERDNPAANPKRGSPEGGSLERLHMEPPQRVRYLWSVVEEDARGERRQESELSFELTPAAGGGTHLRIVHGAFRVSHIIRMFAAAPAVCGPLNGSPMACLRWAA